MKPHSLILGVMLLVAPIELAAQIPTNGLAAYYPFSGNANDFSGFGNNGTVYDVSLTFDRFGNPNSAYYFDGSGSNMHFIDAGNGVSLQISHDITVVLWVKFHSTTAKKNIIGNISTSAPHGWLLNTFGDTDPKYNGTLQWIQKLDAAVFNTWSYVQLYDDTWHCIAYIRQGQTLIACCDGIVRQSFYDPRNPTDDLTPSGDLIIGGDTWGTLDDIRIYNRALSSTEINILYHEGGWTGRSLSLTYPQVGDLLPIGSIQQISWQAQGIQTVQIELSRDNGSTWSTLTSNTPASTGSFAWTVSGPTSDLSTIRVSEVGNSVPTVAASPVFSIEYALFHQQNGAMTLFSMTKDAWSFTNTSNNMWPGPIWHRFPDWNMMVEAFGKDQCLLGSVIPNPTAIALWDLISSVVCFPSGAWNGSCTGFAITSLLAFDERDEFLKIFPWLEGQELFYFSPTDGSPTARDLINKMWLFQFGWDDLRHYASQLFTRTPNETLSDIKTMLADGSKAHSTLSIVYPNGWLFHTVDPYGAFQDPSNPDLWRIRIYDNADGTFKDGPPNPNAAVTVDTKNNVFQYEKYPQLGLGLFLSRPVDVYLSEPKLPSVSDLDSGLHDALVFASRGRSLTITDSTGELVGYQDTTLFGSYDIGIPILGSVGTTTSPLGFYLAKRPVQVSLAGVRDSSSLIMLSSDSSVQWIREELPDTTRILKVDFSQGVKLTGINGACRSTSISLLMPRHGFQTRADVYDLHVSEGDSLQSWIRSSAYVQIRGSSTDKSYSIRLQYADSNGVSTFEHQAIKLEGNSTHLVHLDTTTVRKDSIVIYIDRGNTGRTNDSLRIVNTYTSVGPHLVDAIPRGFDLAQNYPNPFNPATTIRFSLPHRKYVNLSVYNTLGQLVLTLVNGNFDAGYHDVKFDASQMASGIYFYRLSAGSFISTKKMVLLK